MIIKKERENSYEKKICETIKGNRTWNQVCIDGNFYNLDVTWDGYIADDGIQYVVSDYFLIDSNRFNINHIANYERADLYCPSGYSIYVSETKNEGTYVGYLYNGLKSGQGTMYYTSGEKYEGEWVNDNLEGTYYWEDGDYYKGRWVNGKKDGSVTIYYKDGTIVSEIWKDGVKIQ